MADSPSHGHAESEPSGDASTSRLLELSLNLVCTAGFDGYFKYLNPAWEKTLGYLRAELMSSPFIDFVHEEDRVATLSETGKLTAGHVTLNFENRYRTKNGDYRWLLWNATADRQHQILYATATDITDRKQAEQGLNASKERFQLAVQGSSDGLWDWDIPSGAVWYAPRFRELLGYSDAEFPDVFESFESNLHPDDHDRTLERVRAHVDDDEPYDIEYRLRSKKGDYRWFRARGVAVRDDNGQAVRMAGSIQDITDRVDAQTELQDREAQLRAIFNNAVDGLITIDERGSIINFNPAAEDIFGYKAEEVTGKNVKLLMPSPYKEEHDDYLVNYLNTGVQKIIGIGREVSGRRKDGSVFPLDLAVSEVPVKEKRWFAGIIRDVSERKQAERRLKLYADEIARSNRELSDFAHVVSHDLKAPLRGINQLAEWISTDCGDQLDTTGQEQLALLMSRARRMNDLIDGILRYSRIGRGKETRNPVDLGKLVTDTVDLLGKQDHLNINVTSALPTVICEHTQIRQVFQNLISNAIKYMDKPEGQVNIAGTRENNRWHFVVSDNGPGIAERYYDKIFEIFQTLAPPDESKGTGVGLALVKKIIDLHGGRIWVESEVGVGSRFHFTLADSETDRHTPNFLEIEHHG